MRRLPVEASLLFVMLALAAAPAWAQAPVTTTTPISGSGQPVDPSKNVLDALLAAVTRLNDLVAAYVKRQDDLREESARFQNAMRDAETRRVNELAFQKQSFDLELARIRDKGVEASALLLATQVKELKADSSERTSKLEQFANEQRGRTSATDPANVKLLEQVSSLTNAMAVLAGKTNVTDPITVKLVEEVRLLGEKRANTSGGSDMLIYLLGGLGTLLVILLGVGGFVISLMKHNTQAFSDVVRRTNGNGSGA